MAKGSIVDKLYKEVTKDWSVHVRTAAPEEYVKRHIKKWSLGEKTEWWEDISQAARNFISYMGW